MNYFKLIVAVLVSASIVSAAACASHTPAPGNALPRSVQVKDIMREGDNPQALANLLGEQQLPGSSSRVASYFHACAEYNRIDSFRFLISRLTHEGTSRDENLTDLLSIALMHGNTDFANIIMAENFDIVQGLYSLWIPHNQGVPWNLPGLQQFISEHRDQAADFAPLNVEFKRVQSAEDVDALIALSYHCANICGQSHFDPNEALFYLLISTGNSDAQLSKMALRLLQAGADSTSQRVLDGLSMLNPGFVQTIELVRNWIPDEVKITEEDAERMLG